LADTGPAAKAGVMAGDIITAIDDKSIKGLTLEAAFRRISGPVNATIKFKIIRQQQNDPIVVSFAREPVPRTVSSFKSALRTASLSLKQRAAGRSSILTRASRHQWRFAQGMNSTSESGDHTRIAFAETPPAKSTARFSIRDRGSNAACSPIGH